MSFERIHSTMATLHLNRLHRKLLQEVTLKFFSLIQGIQSLIIYNQGIQSLIQSIKHLKKIEVL